MKGKGRVIMIGEEERAVKKKGKRRVTITVKKEIKS